jgi:hypothetical protein
MVALIILKGLFLLNCQASLGGKVCHILIADTPPHAYTAGGASLPADLTYTVDIVGSANPMPFADASFAQNKLVLSSSVNINEMKASRMITVRMPDQILGAAKLSVKTNAVLNGTDQSYLKSVASGSGTYMIPEVLILEYNYGNAFQLTNKTSSFKASSSTIGKVSFMVLTSEPASCDAHPGDHTANFNLMMSIGGKSPTFQLTGISPDQVCSNGDDSSVATLSLGQVIAPHCSIAGVSACLQASRAKDKKKTAKDKPFTVDPNGCGPLIAN